MYRDGEAAVVVASEREDNPGSSITNSYAYLATGVWQKLGLSIEQTTWIEHYGTGSYKFSIDERLDWVTLEREADRLVCPRWRAGSREELERLIGQAFTG